jgi:hypothetical protein
MSNNPYNAPQATPYGQPYGVPVGPPPSARVQGPAIGLLVTAIIGLMLQAGSLLVNLLGVGVGAAAMGEGATARDQQNATVAMMQGGLGIIFGFISIAIGVVILLGALKMKKLQSYGFAMAAAILAMIPCISPCCLIGLPFGIWALVVLMDPQVKAAFT